jgi:hypothetical protein
MTRNTARKPVIAQCSDCHESFTEGAHMYACCPPCREKHQAAWKQEHTRKPGDKRPGWLIGDLCYVKMKGVEYKGKVVDMSDISQREHDHDLVKLELTKTVKGFSGQELSSTWVYPEPVQSYKLRKRVG